jgi:ribosomal protein S18 acetylase RimI-like enzyme
VDDPVALCADAVAGWHESSLTALGLRSESDTDAWRALDAAPPMYFGAIALRPDARADAVVRAQGSVCDPWQALDLEPLGFRVWRRDPWYLRAPTPAPVDAPPELEIVRVTSAREVGEFELVSVRGFTTEDAAVEPGTIHPPSVLSDPRMVLWLGRVDGRSVGAAMSYVTDRAVGIFGVTTVTSARRRGYGSALTCAAMLTETRLPSVLASTREGKRIYERLGFERVGELAIWIRDR